MEWGNDLCLQLIDEYAKHPVLWEPKNDFYFSKKKKHDAWKAIARSLEVQEQEVKRKMCSLMGSFRREKAKWKKDHGGTYVTKWFAFERMQFLLDRDDCGMGTSTEYTDVQSVSDLDATIKTEKDSVSDESEFDHKQYEDVKPMMGSENQKTVPIELRSNRGQRKRAKKTEDHRIDDALKIFKSTASTSASPQDDCAIYGQHVGNKLRNYSSRTRALVEHAINNVLFDADMGKYDNISAFSSHHSTPVSTPSPNP